jgi:hemerythrin
MEHLSPATTSLIRNIDLGLQEIHRQHQGLINEIDRLTAWRENGHALPAIFNMVSALRDYVIRHFRYEEQFLRLHGYPTLDEHIEEHQALTDKVKRFEDQILAGDDIDQDLMALLKEWLTTHIGSEDEAFFHHFAALRGERDKAPAGV